MLSCRRSWRSGCGGLPVEGQQFGSGNLELLFGWSITATVAGEMPLFVETVGSALSQRRAGKLRALAVISPKRDPATRCPDLVGIGAGFRVYCVDRPVRPRRDAEPHYRQAVRRFIRNPQVESLKERIASASYDRGEMRIPRTEFPAFRRAGRAKWKKVKRELNNRAN